MSEQDQDKPHACADGEGLVQKQHAQRQRHRRVDIRDDGGAHRPDLRDQREEQQEGNGRAHHCQDRHGGDDLCRRDRRGKLEHASGCICDRAHRKRRGYDADSGDTAKLPADDHRAHRVADGDHRHLPRSPQIAAGDVKADQRHHPGEADREAADLAKLEAVSCAGRPGEQSADQRNSRDQQAGQRAGEVPLGI